MPSDLPQRLIRSGLFARGDRVICATSGGADSMALLMSLWLVREQLEISVAAAHFDHSLRGEESRRDADFVRNFCQTQGIFLHMGAADVAAYAESSGESLEQAARTLRYAFFQTLPCDKLATAHTADDNAETVLLNLLRGTGLRGLCGIPPRRGNIVRPLLTTTRREIEAFLTERHIPHVEDSTNAADDALRNRIRHRLMPLCCQENPNFLLATAEMTQRLRQDENSLTAQATKSLADCRVSGGYSVSGLRTLPEELLQRVLRQLLGDMGVPQVTRRHVQALEGLVFSPQPSAWIALPGGLWAGREYDRLLFQQPQQTTFPAAALNLNGVTSLPSLQLKILCQPAAVVVNTPYCFTVEPHGPVTVRPRVAGDAITLPGGTKTLKKLMIDRKIPRHLRQLLPVLADQDGVLAVYSVGANCARIGTAQAVTIQFIHEADRPSILSKVRGQEFET